MLLGFVFSNKHMATVTGVITFGALAAEFGRKRILLFSITWDKVITDLLDFVPDHTALARVMPPNDSGDWLGQMKM